MSTETTKLAIWKRAKKILVKRTEKYNLCTQDVETLQNIRDIFTSTTKVNNTRLRNLWLRTNKQSSMLWKEVMEELHTHGKNNKGKRQYQAGIWDEERDEAIKSLNDNGVYVFKKKLQRESVSRIIEALHDEELRPSNSSQQLVDIKTQAKHVLKANDCKYIRWHFNKKVFENIQGLSELSSEPSLLEIACSYLGKKPICTNKQMWISKGINRQSTIESSSAAQLYHFDYDSFNFLKVMIYLSDVCINSGPHTYMKTTHKPFENDNIRKNIAPYGRFSDNEVYDLFGKSNELQICGGAGTVILVDTSGFHKGQVLDISSTRIMAQIEFVDCALQFGHNDIYNG